MNRNKIVFTLLALLMAITLLAGPCLAEETMVSGKVTADNQLVGDDGQVYEVADTENGSKLLEQVDQKVAVKGTVAEQDGKKMITVTSFEVLK